MLTRTANKPVKLKGKRRSWPAPIVAPAEAGLPATEELRLLVLTGEEHWTGGVALPPRLRAKVILGSGVLDLREALFGPETLLDIDVILGEVRVILPPGLQVEFVVAEAFGEAKDKRRSPGPVAPDAPRVLITGSAWLGELKLLEG